METPSTVVNSHAWKAWHAFNFFFGGITFFLGSIILFPIYSEYMKTADVSAWLYSLGSATFLVADITEWLHFTTLRCKYLSYSINFFISVSGSLFYLIGSICSIPSVNKSADGKDYLIIGTSLIFISQAWKEIRLVTQREKSAQEAILEDKSGFYLDFFAGLGGLMYLIGTLFLKKSQQDTNFQLPAFFCYSFGGTFFLTAALFMQKRYFFDNPIDYISPGN